MIGGLVATLTAERTRRFSVACVADLENVIHDCLLQHNAKPKLPCLEQIRRTKSSPGNAARRTPSMKSV